MTANHEGHDGKTLLTLSLIRLPDGGLRTISGGSLRGHTAGEHGELIGIMRRNLEQLETEIRERFRGEGETYARDFDLGVRIGRSGEGGRTVLQSRLTRAGEREGEG